MEESVKKPFDKKVIKTMIICLLAIAFYFFMMYVVADYVITPLVKFLFPIKNYSASELEFYMQLTYDDIPKDLLNILCTRTVFLNLFIDGIMFIALIILFNKGLKADFLKVQSNANKIGYIIIVGVILNYVMAICGNALSQYVAALFNRTGIDSSQNQSNIEMILGSSDFNFLILTLVIVVIGPVIEELVFRKAVFGLCRNKVLGFFVSFLLFGFMHNFSAGYDIIDLIIVSIPYCASGMCFAGLYLYSDNIYVSIIVHIINNFISVLIISLI